MIKRFSCICSSFLPRLALCTCVFTTPMKEFNSSKSPNVSTTGESLGYFFFPICEDPLSPLPVKKSPIKNHQEHLLNPHALQEMHPSPITSGAPQYGHPGMNPKSATDFSFILGIKGNTSCFSGRAIISSICTAVVKCCSKIFPNASGRERMVPLSVKVGMGPRMPFNSSETSSTFTPARKARDIKRHIASDCSWKNPPLLPIVANTSKGMPFSSLLMVTYSLPYPVFTRYVLPAITSGLGP